MNDLDQTMRDPMTQAEVDAITFHPDWDDGREGFVYCRFDALLTPDDDPRHLRAEITWDDNGDDDDRRGIPTTYFAPELWIETNLRNKTFGELVTHEGRRFPLTTVEATALLANDPRAILTDTRYADAIAKLSVPEQES